MANSGEILNDTLEEPTFEAHYQKVETEALALPVERVRKINLDPAIATTSSLALMAGILRFRGQIVEYLKDFNVERFDRLESYTKALSVSNSRYMIATTPPDSLQATYERGLELRELIHTDAKTLAGRGLINADALRDYSGLVGFRNVGIELQNLALLLKDNWSNIEGRCATSEAELKLALRLSERLQLGAGERTVNPAVVAEYSETRNRMFTLFIEAYEDARAAIRYLRRDDGDAETIAPTLYTNRGSSKKTPTVESTTETATATTTTTTTTATPQTPSTTEPAKANTSTTQPYMS